MLTPQEIDEKIRDNNKTIEQIDEKLKKLVENSDFKSMQNGTDRVETQDIGTVINSLRNYRSDLLEENKNLENLKLSCCEKKKYKSKLWSNFYGY